MASCVTEFSGYAVKFSPFEENKIACATAQNFGIMGNGQQLVCELSGNGVDLEPVLAFETQDGLYDCAWSEECEYHLVSACGDGSLKLWDLEAEENPLRSYEDHTHEVYSVDWNMVGKDTFVSGSWDNSIKLWTLNEDAAMQTFNEHKYCIYSTMFNPYSNETLASASGDHTLKIWDVNELHSTLTLQAHGYEILTCDWSKYNENEIVTGAVDKTLRVWDIRAPEEPLISLEGHTFAVRRARYSPHSETFIASVSYDMTMKLWDIEEEEDPLLESCEHHSEFVVGLDWNISVEGQIATCSWDRRIAVWLTGEEPPELPLPDEEDGFNGGGMQSILEQLDQPPPI